MQISKNINEAAAQVMEEAKNKDDYTVPGTSLKMMTPQHPDYEEHRDAHMLDGMLSRIRGTRHGAESVDTKQPPYLLGLETEHDGTIRLPIQSHCHSQIATRMNIPRKYYEHMRTEKADELLTENVNYWFRHGAGRGEHLVRTLQGQARALLSTSYRVLDNVDIMNIVLELIAQHDLTVQTCNVSDSNLHIIAVSERLRGDVKLGDAVQAGVIISNSEVGAGRYKWRRFVYRLSCLNGMVGQNIVSQSHLGKDQTTGEGAEHYLKSETLRAKDTALFLETRDLVGGALSEAAWQGDLKRMREAADVEITGDITKMVPALGKKLNMRESEASDCLKFLAQGGDLSKWGLANAVTACAHGTIDEEGMNNTSFDRNIELQALGSNVLEMSMKEWEVLNASA